MTEGGQALQAGGFDLLSVDRRALPSAGHPPRGIPGHLRSSDPTARGEAGPEGDVDVLIDLEPDAQVGLFEHARIAEELAVLFGRPVDLVARASLKPRFREAVALEAITLVAR